MFEGSDDFESGEIFGIDESVDAHLFDEPAVVGIHVVVACCTGHCCRGAEVLGHCASNHIVGFIRSYGNEQVGRRYAGFTQTREVGRASDESHYVVVGVERGEFVGVFVDENNILVFVGQEFCEVRSNFACSGNDNLHFSELFFSDASDTMVLNIDSASMPHSCASWAGVP